MSSINAQGTPIAKKPKRKKALKKAEKKVVDRGSANRKHGVP